MRNRKHAEQKHKRENSESVCTRNLIRSLRTPVQFLILLTRAKIPYGQTFLEVFPVGEIVIRDFDSSCVYDVHNLSTEIQPRELEKML